MKLLDDHIPINSELSTESIKEKLLLKKKYSKLKKQVNNARVALGVVAAFTVISIFGLLRVTDDPLVVSVVIGLTVIFGICAAVEPKYATYSLSVGLGLYLLNLAASIFQASPLLVLSLIVKGIVIFFLVVGLNAAIKLRRLSSRMEMLGITPYKD